MSYVQEAPVPPASDIYAEVNIKVQNLIFFFKHLLIKHILETLVDIFSWKCWLKYFLEILVEIFSSNIGWDICWNIGWDILCCSGKKLGGRADLGPDSSRQDLGQLQLQTFISTNLITIFNIILMRYFLRKLSCQYSCLYLQHQVFCVFILSVVSLLVYFRDASAEGVEHCIPYYKNTSQQVDLAFNVGFMVYFLIRVRCTFVQIFWN